MPRTKTIRLPWYIQQAIKSGPVPVVRDWRNLPLDKLTRAEINMRWIEKYCKIPEGDKVGEPLVIELFFQVFMYAVFDSRVPIRKAILSIARKNAKALALDTPIPTPDGWRAMADIEPGDYVFGRDGKPTKVLAVSDIFYNKPCYEVGFSDGSKIVASGDHLWTTRHAYRPWDKDARRNGSGFGGNYREGVVTTEQIHQSLRRPRTDGGTEYNHKIDVASAVDFRGGAKLRIDPYVLGAWLGDGNSRSPQFTCAEKDLPFMCEQLERSGHGEIKVLRGNGTRAPTIACTHGGLSGLLRGYNLYLNKHIPEEYFEASCDDRRALLQGLMDTDGTVSRHNGKATARASFTSKVYALAQGVWRLARSLGIKASLIERRATLRGVDCGPIWICSFNATKHDGVFRMPRKNDLLPDTLGKRSGTLSIVSCERVASVPTKCIKVDAADELFLAGHGCVATHNTAYIACLMLLFVCGPERKLNSRIASGALSRDQAAEVFNFAYKMIMQDETLSRATRVVVSSKKIIGLSENVEYSALSAEGATNHGKGPLVAVLDEVGQVRGPTNDFFEAITTSQGALSQPLLVMISTQAATDNDYFSIELDAATNAPRDTVVCHQYSAAEDAALDDQKAWQAANPSLGRIKQIAAMEDDAKEAAQQPSKENSFRWLHLNQRIEASAPFVSRDLWKANGAPAHIPEGSDVWLGYDLSAVSDLTAEVMIARIDDIWHVVPTFWVPGTGLLEKSREDKVPYTKWRDDGHLIATPGNTVDYDFVAHHILHERFRKYRVQNAAFDRKFFNHLKPKLIDAGMTEDELELFVDFQQGYKGMTPALRTLEADLTNHRLAHGNHPVLTMCAANAIVKEMPSGTQRMLVKPHPKRRIDGMISLAMAHGLASEAAPEEASFWEAI